MINMKLIIGMLCLIKKCQNLKPDLVFILKGEIIYPETLEWIKENTNAK